MANPLTKIVDFVSSFIPVERWVRMLKNVLRALGLAFVLCFFIVLLLLVRDWGFSNHERLGLIYFFGTLMFATVTVIVILALKTGDILYAPQERALRRGKQFGNEREPVTMDEALRLPDEPRGPTLPGADEQKQIGQR